jgi:transcriptional regulator with XRE-family HTH domain
MVISMPRKPDFDAPIGERIRTRRQLRGWSIRHAADRAALSHTTWSRIERGLLGADNRFVLAAIAEALECATLDLTGGPVLAVDRDLAAGQLGVSRVLGALVETDLSEPATCTPRPLPEVARDAELIQELRLRCEYASATRMLPRILRELHAHAAGRDRAQALRLLVRTADSASYVVRYLGYPAEAWLASDRSRDAALALGDPVMLGLSAWSLGHSAAGCDAYGRIVRITEAAAAALEPQYGLADAPEMLGQLQMLTAFGYAAQGHREAAAGWAGESAKIAKRIGDVPTLGLSFGPTNVNIWHVSMEVDGGDPAKAVEIARRTNPTPVALSRQTNFYADAGRALARIGKDAEAIRMLLTAERLGPQRVHNWRLVQETARVLLERSQRRAGGSELRGLCERMGLVH